MAMPAMAPLLKGDAAELDCAVPVLTVPGLAPVPDAVPDWVGVETCEAELEDSGSVPA